MKKIYLLILISLLFVNLSYSGDRMVLVERFTSSTCPPCASNNPIMDAFLSSQDQDRIVGISYHMNWPAPGNDPMYLYNPNDNNTRRTHYSINSIPEARMDGLINVLPSYNSGTLTNYFNSRKDSLSPITVIVTDSTFGDSMWVRALVYCETALSNTSASIYFAIIEKHIHYSYPPGTNGETDFYDVMRIMPVTGNGQLITLYPGQFQVFERRFKIDPIWQQNQIKPLVFVQASASNKEILNAAVITANFTLLPTIGYKAVNQGSNQSANFRLRTPVVSSGYNSPITVTAQVIPPTSGVSVSFPNGSIISNYSDSLQIQVNSTSTVPNGDYRIILTGVNTNGKTHKTSVTYLVGKSYVFVNSNKASLQFKVDNVTYNSSKLFTWDLNSSHILSAVTPQTFGAIRYIFFNWSDGGDTTHTINTNTTVNNYTVNYKTQYKLLTSITPSGIPATITNGNIYFDSGSVANLSISPLQVQFNNQTYWFQRWQGSGNGSYTGIDPNPQILMLNPVSESAVWDTIAPIGIKGIGTEVPVVYNLYQNYPNPFNPVTNIKFDLPEKSLVVLKIYDVIGNEVAELINQQMNPGYYQFDYNASNLASGVYFYKFTAGSFISLKKMVLIK